MDTIVAAYAAALKGGMTVRLLCPVVLRSRIGSPYVFELTSFDAHGNWPAQARSSPSDSDTSRVLKRIQIAKEDVKSWPSIDALKVNDDARRSTAVAVDSLRVLTYLDQRLLSRPCEIHPHTQVSRATL